MNAGRKPPRTPRSTMSTPMAPSGMATARPARMPAARAFMARWRLAAVDAKIK
jgi:hypothetical protein